jgi:hypothetical protein
MRHRLILVSYNMLNLDRSSNLFLSRFKRDTVNEYPNTHRVGILFRCSDLHQALQVQDSIRNQEQLVLAVGRGFTTRSDVIRGRSLSRNHEGGA